MEFAIDIADNNGIFRAINGTFMAINGGFPYFNLLKGALLLPVGQARKPESELGLGTRTPT